MQAAGYDELSRRAQKSLDDTLKQVEGNAAIQEQVIAMMLKRTQNNYEQAYDAIDKRIKQTGTVIGTTTKKQIADLNSTLAPLQAWAAQVQANQGTLSQFSTEWDTVVNHIATTPIRFIPPDVQPVLEKFGLLTDAAKEYVSWYEKAMGGTGANGQQLTSFDSNTDKKQAEQAAGGETAAQAKARREVLTKMYNYAKSRSVASTKDINDHKNDELWKYLYNLTGKHTTATEMAHLAQYLRDLGADLEGVPYKSKVNSESDLSMDARNKILAAMKQYGFGTNQWAANYIKNRTTNRALPDAGTVLQKQKDDLWAYLYELFGQDLTEYEMLHIGKAYTNVKDLPTEASFKNNPNAKLTEAQKKAILLALQYNGMDLSDYILSPVYGMGKTTTQSTSSGGTDAVAKSSDIVGSLANDSSPNKRDLKTYIYNVTGKSYSEADLVELAVKQGISGVTSGQRQLDDRQALNLLNKLKQANWNGHAKGTASIPYTGSHWTHSGELLVRKDGAYLTPLSKGDGVIPANLTQNLMKWGAIDPSAFLMKMGKVPTANSTQNVTYNNSYDSLLTVNGDVDKDALPELKEILKQACEYTNKFNAREARKLGRK